MIDVFVEHNSTPPEGFEDNLYNQLSRYIFEQNTRETRERIRLDVSNCVTQFWPDYPLGLVLVDTLSLHDVNVTVKMKEEPTIEDVECDVNYECDYYTDYSAEMHHDEIWEAIETNEVAQTADDILYSTIER